MDWKCPNCNEVCPGAFDTCWNCGTNEFGDIDSEFKKADEFEKDELDVPDKKSKAVNVRRAVDVFLITGFLSMALVAFRYLQSQYLIFQINDLPAFLRLLMILICGPLFGAFALLVLTLFCTFTMIFGGAWLIERIKSRFNNQQNS